MNQIIELMRELWKTKKYFDAKLMFIQDKCPEYARIEYNYDDYGCAGKYVIFNASESEIISELKKLIEEQR